MLYIYREWDGADKMNEKYLIESDSSAKELTDIVLKKTNLQQHTFEITPHRLELIKDSELIDTVTKTRKKKLIEQLNKTLSYSDLKHLGIEHLYEGVRQSKS